MSPSKDSGLATADLEPGAGPLPAGVRQGRALPAGEIAVSGDGSRPRFWIECAQSFGLGGPEHLPVGGDKQHRFLQGLL